MVVDEALVSALEAELKRAMTGSDAAHDLHHCRRVFANALEIAGLQGAGREDILCAAAYLHDLVNVPKDSPDRHRASTLSAEAAVPILRKLSFSAEDIAAVCHAIEAHSFSAGMEPQKLEAQILQDADRLESLGALGIARTFYIAGKMDSELFAADDPFAMRRPLDDKRYAVDHFFKKLLKLPATMKTSAGRQLAEKRVALLNDFLEDLAGELRIS